MQRLLTLETEAVKWMNTPYLNVEREEETHLVLNIGWTGVQLKDNLLFYSVVYTLLVSMEHN